MGGAGFAGNDIIASVAYYDKNKNFISSLVYSTSSIFTWIANIPKEAIYYRATTRIEDISFSYILQIDLSKKADHGYTNEDIIKTLKQVEEELSNYNYKITEFPLSGVYLTATGWIESINWMSVNLTDLTEGQKIFYGIHSTTNANIITVFNKDGVIIDNIPASGSISTFIEGVYTVPASAVKIGISTHTTYSDAYYIIPRNMNEVITEILQKIENILDNKTVILTVKKDSTITNTNFNTLTAAVAAWKKDYKIHVFEGIYEELGIVLPDGCEIYGIGNVEIRGELPDSASSSNIENKSTLDMFQGGILENLTVTARNMRYPIHADFSNGNTIKKIRNCRFIHYGNAGAYQYRVSQGTGTESEITRAMSAWGGGTKAGDFVDIDSCYFESPMRGFSTHNNTNFNSTYGASYVIIKNSRMISHGIDRDGSNLSFQVSAHIQSLISNTPDRVVFENCDLNGYLCMQTVPTQEVYTDCVGLKQIWNYAGGSKSIAFGWSWLDVNWYPKIKGEISSYKNVSSNTLLRGKAVKRSGIGIDLFTNADNIDDFFGVLMQDVESGKAGDVKFSGYIPYKYLTGSNENVIEGSNISVDSTGTFFIGNTLTVMKVSDNNNVLIKSPFN